MDILHEYAPKTKIINKAEIKRYGKHIKKQQRKLFNNNKNYSLAKTTKSAKLTYKQLLLTPQQTVGYEHAEQLTEVDKIIIIFLNNKFQAKCC